MELNKLIVKIAAERIMNKGLNPKTKKTYVLNDVTNPLYKEAIETYILQHQ